MGAIYRFLASYEPLIYITLAIGGLFAFRMMWRSWLEWRNAVYSLEREFALRRLGQATAAAVLVLFLMFAEFFVASFVVPGLPASDLLTTPTVDLLAMPSDTLSPSASTQTVLSPIQPTVPSGVVGCVPDRIMITSPKSGEEVKKTVELVGTADIPNFGFYKYEVAQYGTQNWVTISAGREPRKAASLGLWNTTALANGDYQLQFVVTDNLGQTLPPCVITIRVVN